MKVDVAKTDATHTLLEGDPLEVRRHGTQITISCGEPAVHPIPPADAPEPESASRPSTETPGLAHADELRQELS